MMNENKTSRNNYEMRVDEHKKVVSVLASEVEAKRGPVANATDCLNKNNEAIEGKRQELLGEIIPALAKAQTAFDMKEVARKKVAYRGRQERRRAAVVESKWKLYECRGSIRGEGNDDNGNSTQASSAPAPATATPDKNEKGVGRTQLTTLVTEEDDDVLVGEVPVVRALDEGEESADLVPSHEVNTLLATEAEPIAMSPVDEAKMFETAAVARMQAKREQEKADALRREEARERRVEAEKAQARVDATLRAQVQSRERASEAREREAAEAARINKDMDAARADARRERCSRYRELYQRHVAKALEHEKEAGDLQTASQSEREARDALEARRKEANREVRQFSRSLEQCTGADKDAIKEFRKVEHLHRLSRWRQASLEQHLAAALAQYNAHVLAEIETKRVLDEAEAELTRRQREYSEARAAAQASMNKFHSADVFDPLNEGQSTKPLPPQQVGFWDKRVGRVALKAVALNEWNEVYVVTAEGNIEHFAREAPRRPWVFVPGGEASRGVSVDCRGNVWKVNAGGDVLKMVGRNLWEPLIVKKVRGKAVRAASIAVASLQSLYIVEAGTGQVSRYNPNTQTYDRVIDPASPKLGVRGGFAKVAVSCHGDLWALGRAPEGAPQKGAPLFRLAQPGEPHNTRFNWDTHQHEDTTGTWVLKGLNILDVSSGEAGAFAVGANGHLAEYRPPKTENDEDELDTHWWRYDNVKLAAVAAGNDGSLNGITLEGRDLVQYQPREEGLLPEGERAFLEIERRGHWEALDRGLPEGWVSKVAVGKDGRMFALVKDPVSLLLYNPHSSAWQVQPNANLVSLSRSCDKTTVGINTAGNLVGWDVATQQWLPANFPVMGKLLDVAVCDKNSIYAIRLSPEAENVRELVRWWPEGHRWITEALVPVDHFGTKAALNRKPAGQPVQVDCGCNGVVAVVDDKGSLYASHGDTHLGPVFERVAEGVRQVTVAHEIFLVAEDWSVYKFSFIPAVGTGSGTQWGKDNRWAPLHVRLASIASDGEGNLYGVNAMDEAVRFVRTNHPLGWQFVDADVEDVYVGGPDMILGKTPAGALVMRDREHGEWRHVLGLPTPLEGYSVGCDGTTLAIGSKLGGVYRLEGGLAAGASASNTQGEVSTKWTRMGEESDHIEAVSVGSGEEDMWGLDINGSLFLYSPSKGEWLELASPVPASAISTSCAGDVWIIGKNDHLPYRRDHLSGTWEKTSETRVVKVAAGDNIYVLDEQQRLYRYEPESLEGKWVALGDHKIYDVSAGRDDAVYAVDIFNRLIEINEGITYDEDDLDENGMPARGAKFSSDGVPKPLVPAKEPIGERWEREADEWVNSGTMKRAQEKGTQAAIDLIHIPDFAQP